MARDSSTQPARTAIYAMVAVHVLLGTFGIWIFVAFNFGHHVLREILAFALLMLGPSQASLLGLWAAFAGRGSSWRTIAVIALVFGHFALNERFFDSSEMQFWLAVQVLQMLPWLLALLAARLLGLRLVRGEDLQRQGFRFSLRRGLGWITAVAVVLTAIRWMPEDYPSSFLRFEGWAIPAACSLVAAASVWLILGRRWLPVRLLALPVAIAASTMILRKGIGFLDVWVYATLMAIEAAWLVASLLVVRRAGYRFVWQWRFGSAQVRDREEDASITADRRNQTKPPSS